MLFNSLHFLIFFGVVSTAYFMLKYRWRWCWLLAASCYFYMFFVPAYILILAFTIIVDYIAGIMIERSSGHRRQLFLIASLLANIGILCFFKYYNFINENITALLGWAHVQNPIPALDIILPVGLSFHTFQAISYTIEVYRGHQKAERHFGIYALYVIFYPQLVAGPIERPQNLLHQFHEEHAFDYSRISNGLKLMLWGFFKKVVVADRLAILVNEVYDHPVGYSGLPLIIATVLFAFQIFCDFSGYSDIAIGAAKVMGFKLMTNFNKPYFSTSISTFWKRWHISLSTWFRDYLYIPLGGNRVSTPRWYVNLMIIFLVSGLWHGAKFTFVIWGALHGGYIILQLITRKYIDLLFRKIGLDSIPLLKKIIRITFTFTLVCFTWIFFRAKTVDDALYIVSHLTAGFAEQVCWLWQGRQNVLHLVFLDKSYMHLVTGLCGVALMETVHVLIKNKKVDEVVAAQPVWIRWGLYYLFVMIILIFGVFEHAPQFIYFQF